MIIWHNGEFRDSGDPVFACSDRALLGDGVFDTMLAADGEQIFGRPHMDRLVRHAAVLDIKVPYNPEELLSVSAELLDRNGFVSGFHALKTIVTMGPGGRGLDLPENPAPTCIITAVPVPDPRTLPDISAVISRDTRRNEMSPLARVKSLSYADNRLARQEARRRGSNEAVMLNTKGYFACAATGNLYFAVSGEIYTPPSGDGALDGVIRQSLVGKKIVQERSLGCEELERCSGVWISNSITGIRKVSSIDGKRIEYGGAGLPDMFDLT